MTHPEGRLVTRILIQCGLRATDACTLSFDCLIHDGAGAPYLRYFNHKMRREAAVPIDPDLEAQIRAQQQRVAKRWPGQHPHLFPQPTGNVGGRRALTYHSYRGMLNAWLALCDIHDEHGEPVHLTPRQWRHTFAGRLINRDVPQEVVRVLLDHGSTEMTELARTLTGSGRGASLGERASVSASAGDDVLDEQRPNPKRRSRQCHSVQARARSEGA